MIRPQTLIRILLCVGTALHQAAQALDNTQLAVIVNTRDPLSVAIGDYYAERRKILFQNIIKVSFTPGQATLTRAQFEILKAQVDEQTQPNVQAYAVAWTLPYRVDCMSITSAFAFGFDPTLCAEGCRLTRVSPYYNSGTRLPYTQLRMRPAMAIAAASFEEARSLIDRGVRSDGSNPTGTAYLLSTSDRSRNVRHVFYPDAERMLQGQFRVQRMTQDRLTDKDDVMFYFTGTAHVEGLGTLVFLPGAIGDHLTSTGGNLHGTSQMSALRWLEAGATASYGTVVEPCAFAQKFPNPIVAIGHYLRGETLIEAYWKSVLMPGQGIFIGEPLAAPFKRVSKQ
jgi:uncharacterized protein (TIGR03790 family)